MTITDVIQDLNKAFKTENEKKLEDKVEQLEKIIINLVTRLDYLETRCQ